MLHRVDEARALLIKCINEEVLTAEEQLQLKDWLSKSEKHPRELEVLLDDNAFANLFLDFAEKMKQQKKQPLRSKPAIIRRFTWRRRIYRASAAAAAILLISIGSYYFIGRSSTGADKQLVLKNVKPNAVLPVSNKAILILADNRRIVLSNTGNESIAIQGSSIVRSADGGLEYKDAGPSTSSLVRATNIVITPRGGSYRIILPDGTLAVLNADSYCKYATTYDGSPREVEMKGEVFFHVAKHIGADNRPVPFSVKLENGTTVHVLGTQFNVNNYYAASKTTTTLLEGKISLTVPQNDHTLLTKELTPGQRAVVRGSAISVQKTDAEASIYWMKNRFYFEESTLSEVMAEISRNYDVDVVYETPIPEGSPINGSIYKNVPLDQLLENLPLITGTHLTFKLRDRSIVVTH
jgi:ferric-dicitrate binding protein FerR (iron transport regulator)